MALTITGLIQKLKTFNPGKDMINCYHLDNNRRMELRDTNVIRANTTDEVIYEIFVEDGKLIGVAAPFDMIQNIETQPMTLEEASLLITDLTQAEKDKLKVNLK